MAIERGLDLCHAYAYPWMAGFAIKFAGFHACSVASRRLFKGSRRIPRILMVTSTRAKD